MTTNSHCSQFSCSHPLTDLVTESRVLNDFNQTKLLPVKTLPKLVGLPLLVPSVNFINLTSHEGAKLEDIFKIQYVGFR